MKFSFLFIGHQKFLSKSLEILSTLKKIIENFIKKNFLFGDNLNFKVFHFKIY